MIYNSWTRTFVNVRFSRFLELSQDSYLKTRIHNVTPGEHWNLNIHTEIPESTLYSQDPNYHSRIHTQISVATLESLGSYWKPKIYTGIQRFTLESQNPQEYQDPHWKLSIPAENHWNPAIHITIPRTTSKSLNLYRSPRNHNGNPGLTLKSHDP